MEWPQDVYLPSDTVSYKLSLEDIDLGLLPMGWLMDKYGTGKALNPCASQGVLRDSTPVEFEVSAEREDHGCIDIKNTGLHAIDQKPTRFCHICNIAFPKKFLGHNQTNLHMTLLRLTHEAVSRLEKHIQQQLSDAEDTYCASSDAEIKSIEVRGKLKQHVLAPTYNDCTDQASCSLNSNAYTTFHTNDFQNNSEAQNTTVENCNETIKTNEEYAIDQKPTRFCHVCNIAVPQKFFIEHNQSHLHITLLRLTHEAVSRLEKHIQQQLSDAEDTCTLSDAQIKSIEVHGKLIKPQLLKRREDLMVTLLDIYTKEHGTYTDFTDQASCPNSNVHTTFNTNDVENNLKAHTERQIKNTTVEDYNETIKTKTETKASPHKLERPLVVKSKKTSDKKLVKEKLVLEQDLIEIRSKYGDSFVVPQYHFHGIQVSSDRTANAMACMMCNKIGMTEAEIQKHIKSYYHLAFIQKLIPDNHGIRKNTNIFLSCQSLNHCVVCNFMICDAALHIDSRGHQKHYSKMKKSVKDIQKSAVDKNITTTANEQYKVKPEEIDRSLKTTSSHQSQIEPRCASKSIKKNITVNKNSVQIVKTCDVKLKEPDCPRKTNFPVVANNNMTTENNLLNTQREKVILSQALIEARTENGDLLLVPHRHFHGIGISRNHLSESSTNIMRCMLCKERGMTETSVLTHIESSIHNYLIRKLVLDKHSIRKFTYFVFNGQPLGHCVVCNFIICDAALHVASPEHQKCFNEMKISAVNAKKTSAGDNNNASATNEALRDKLNKSVIPLQSASEHYKPTMPRLAVQIKSIGFGLDNNRKPTPNKALTDKPEHCNSLEGKKCSKSPVKTHPDKAILAQDLIETRTENGVLLKVPQYHFHGIRISSNCINRPEANANPMRCLLCKKKGMTETHVQMHIKSSTHVNLIQKLILDQHGIRKLLFPGQSLGHCVVCNSIVTDSALHIVSPEHQKKKQIFTSIKKKSLGNAQKTVLSPLRLQVREIKQINSTRISRPLVGS